MPTPENRNLNTPPVHVNDLGDEREVERATRGGWRWWWIWPIVAALVLWWAGWGWGGTGGWWWGRINSRNTAISAPPGARTTETIANAGAQQPVTNAGADAGGARPQEQMIGPGTQILAARNKRAYIGKEFLANYVPVQQKASDHAVWIGADNTMLAVVPRNSSNGAVDSAAPGKLVDAKGTVEKAPSVAQAKREWSLSDQDASRLEHEGAYIQVSRLTVPQQ